jgi:hypothetical protein
MAWHVSAAQYDKLPGYCHYSLVKAVLQTKQKQDRDAIRYDWRAEDGGCGRTASTGVGKRKTA